MCVYKLVSNNYKNHLIINACYLQFFMMLLCFSPGIHAARSIIIHISELSKDNDIKTTKLIISKHPEILFVS